MENFIVQGIITQTSNKQSDKFVGGEPRKSVYLSVDEKNEEILVAKGFTKYSSTDEETGEVVNFFILKTAKEVKIYTDQSGVHKSVLDGIGQEGVKNFSSNGKKVVLDIVQGEKNKNKFSRLSSIFDPNGFVTENEKINPFAELEL